MAKRLVKIPAVKPIVLGCYTLTAIGLEVKGRPSLAEHEGVGDFINRAHRASGFWLGDWLRYGESRVDWQERLSQAESTTGLSEKTLKNVRAIAGSVALSRRRDGVEFDVHAEVAGLQSDEQEHWLARAESEGWGVRELRLNIRASKRAKIIEGQAVLEGMYRVVIADPPWSYGDRPPSGSGAHEHYPSMSIDDLCRLPVAAHLQPNAVMFLWTTAPILLQTPGPREVLEAWGLTPKTGMVWRKRNHNFGHYVSIRHEHVIIATRGSCLPDRPTPMPDSVFTSAQMAFEHSEKPPELRQIVEKLYDGPFLELFGRTRVPGWTVFGHDARLWTQDVATV